LALPPSLTPFVNAPDGALRALTGPLRCPPLPSRLPLVLALSDWIYIEFEMMVAVIIMLILMPSILQQVHDFVRTPEVAFEKTFNPF